MRRLHRPVQFLSAFGVSLRTHEAKVRNVHRSSDRRTFGNYCFDVTANSNGIGKLHEAMYPDASLEELSDVFSPRQPIA